jgi:DNA-binding HxlR family transcriptional regulator
MRAARARDLERVRQLLHSGEGARALRLIGDRWSLLILRDTFLGVRRFEDLLGRTGATRGTLATRLAALVEYGILQRNPAAHASKRFEYRLTEKGLGLYPVALSLWVWECRWSDAADLPPSLVHISCGNKLTPLQVCSHCRGTIASRDVGFEPGPGERAGDATTQATRRRGPGSRHLAEGIDRTLFHAVDTIGDRWSVLLIATLFFGLHRYDDINSAIGISTNILADRLRNFLAAGVVEQRLYRERPVRYEYHLTQKGWDLFPFTVAIHEWAARWMPAPEGPALRLRHQPAGHLLVSRMICAACQHEIDPHDVAIKPGPRRRAARAAPPKRTPTPRRTAAARNAR